MNNVLTISKERCYGCTACKAICPAKAIEFKADEQGFLYPVVDERKCVSCGQCLNVCLNKKDERSTKTIAFAVKNENAIELRKSSSGGISVAIAKYVIQNGGTVYGVAYDSNYEVITKRFDSQSQLESLYGSKYVQTNIKNTFLEIFDDLKLGKKVAFFGTSCHVAGLKSFIKAKHISDEGLITIDLICHGTPSPKLFSEYISWLKKNKKFVKYEFRTKNKPWGYGSKNYGCTITYLYKQKNEKKEIDTSKTRLFLNLFFSNNCLRPCCYECPYATVDKPSDLTMADYWGCKDEEEAFFSEDGVSAVLAHTVKGSNFVENLPGIKWIYTSVEKIKKKQANLSSPSIMPPSYDSFWKYYYKNGFVRTAKKYGGYSLTARIKGAIKKLVSKKD